MRKYHDLRVRLQNDETDLDDTKLRVNSFQTKTYSSSMHILVVNVNMFPVCKYQTSICIFPADENGSRMDRTAQCGSKRYE